MQKRPYLFPVFITCIIVTLFIFALSLFGIMNGPVSLLQKVSFSAGSVLSQPFIALQNLGANKEIATLREENLSLSNQLSKMQQIQADNNALRDQFSTTTILSTSVLAAHVIGTPNVLPNISYPQSIMVDKGQSDRVKKGDVVVYKNNLVGQVAQVFAWYSKIDLVTSDTSRFSGLDAATSALGVVRGEGNGDMVLDNVLLSDNLHSGDLVITKGDVDYSGQGFMPGLVVGKITAVEKNPSSLFQKASIKSLLSLDRLLMVFIIR